MNVKSFCLLVRWVFASPTLPTTDPRPQVWPRYASCYWHFYRCGVGYFRGPCLILGCCQARPWPPSPVGSPQEGGTSSDPRSTLGVTDHRWLSTFGVWPLGGPLFFYPGSCRVSLGLPTLLSIFSFWKSFGNPLQMSHHRSLVPLVHECTLILNTKFKLEICTNLKNIL